MTDAPATLTPNYTVDCDEPVSSSGPPCSLAIPSGASVSPSLGVRATDKTASDVAFSIRERLHDIISLL